MTYLNTLMALILAMIHLFGRRLHLAEMLPRRIWLSSAAGTSVAYVFVDILPRLETGQAVLEEEGILDAGFLSHHIYIAALVGLLVFYGLESLVQRGRQAADAEGLRHSPGIFWVHAISFAIYSVLIGYLLVHPEDPSPSSLILFTIALGLHFMVMDYALWQECMNYYRAEGRWILAGSVFLGWGIGVVTKIDRTTLELLFAFLAGAILLNTLKEELPSQMVGGFWSFVLGAAVYTILLLIV